MSNDEVRYEGLDINEPVTQQQFRRWQTSTMWFRIVISMVLIFLVFLSCVQMVVQYQVWTNVDPKIKQIWNDYKRIMPDILEMIEVVSNTTSYVKDLESMFGVVGPEIKHMREVIIRIDEEHIPLVANYISWAQGCVARYHMC